MYSCSYHSNNFCLFAVLICKICCLVLLFENMSFKSKKSKSAVEAAGEMWTQSLKSSTKCRPNIPQVKQDMSDKLCKMPSNRDIVGRFFSSPTNTHQLFYPIMRVINYSCILIIYIYSSLWLPRVNVYNFVPFEFLCFKVKMSVRNIRGRDWMATFNNPNVLPDVLIQFFVERQWNYIFQLERGQSGTEHYQIYLRTNPMYFNHVNQYFVDRGFVVHLEHVRNKNSAMLYCCKIDSRVSDQYWTDIENLIIRPKVKSLVSIKRKLDSGETLLSIMDNEEFFPTWCSYNRSLVMYNSLKQPKRNFKTFCVYFFGEPGVGKSRLAFDICKYLFPEVTPYYKTKGQWWDLFSNEVSVIWDDFRGDCYEAQELFKLCDRYDYKVQIKGGFMNFNSKIIIFTSNCN